MPTIVSLPFERYRLRYFAGDFPGNRLHALITCHRSAGTDGLEEGPLVGLMHFHENQPTGGATLSTGVGPDPSSKRIYLQFSVDRLQQILWSLTHEKPLFLSYWEDGETKRGMLNTGSEPIGNLDWEDIDL